MEDSELEMDLDLLEDMCSDLEECVFLVDGSINVVWANNVLKETLAGRGYESHQRSLYAKGILELFSIDINSDPHLKNALSKGKFSKNNAQNSTSNFRVLYLPIKHRQNVAFVLAIIEEKKIHRQENIDFEAIMVKYFIKDVSQSCIYVSPDKSLIVTNGKFDSEFHKSEILKRLIMNSMKENKMYAQKYLKDILSLSHDLECRPLILDKKDVGLLYLFRRIRGK